MLTVALLHTLPVHCRIPWTLHIVCRAVCILKYKLVIDANLSLHMPQGAM